MKEKKTYKLERTSLAGFVKNPLGTTDWTAVDAGLTETEASNRRLELMTKFPDIYVRMIKE